ncbi:HAD family phosphatase [Candidatus Saccharibacteria bacterium]|nr:HAD family phosphatase [Candidatus Saccharibacteria bacterium]
MSEIKLVLSDMDDTLAPHMQNEVSSVVRQAVIDVERRGIEIAVVTGRAYIHAKGVLTALGIEGPCVLDGGATIVDAVSAEILWKQWLDVQTTRQITNVLKKYCSEAYLSSSYEMQPLNELNLDQIHEDAPCVFAVAETIDQIKLAVAELDDMKGIQVFSGIGSHPETSESCPAIQITHELANKFHGVEALREIVGIPKEHTLAIGDGNNDVPLFQNARVKVAMGNATAALKAEADYIVGSLEQDGFAEAMTKYVLSKELE